MVKQFGRFAALRGVTAEFDAGKFYGILGDNGAGKTTLLRALAGLATPTRGTISILGKSPRESCRDVGYMAHPSLLYDEMSGLENLRYFARLYDIAGDGRCEDVIRSVRLDPALARPVGQYSQGMRQRMSLARAILQDPKILLLDEPFSNVDVHSAREIVGLLKEMRDSGKTIFVVTHQASLLEGVADEFVWMQAGQIIERTAGLTPQPSGNAMSSIRSITLATLTKDIRLEWRSRDAINSMLFFSLLVVVIFSFSFDPNAEESRQIAGGLIWVAFLFAAVVALESDVGARASKPGAGCLSRFSRSRECFVCREGVRKLYFGELARSGDGAAVYDFLQPARCRACLATDPGGDPWDVGAGGEWDLFRGDVFAHAQPRNHAAVAAVSHLDSSRAVHGGSYAHHSHRRRFGALLDRIASHLRCGVYYSLSGFVRNHFAG